MQESALLRSDLRHVIWGYLGVICYSDFKNNHFCWERDADVYSRAFLVQYHLSIGCFLHLNPPSKSLANIWAHVANVKEASHLPPSSGSSLTDAVCVAQAGRKVTRIHRQKEKETSIWARPLPGPGRLSLLLVQERAPRVSGFSCLRLPFSQGKEFISEEFQFQTLKLPYLTLRSSVPCIGAHPITVWTLFHPLKPPRVYLSKKKKKDFLAKDCCFIWAILHNGVLGKSQILTQGLSANGSSKEGQHLNCPSTYEAYRGHCRGRLELPWQIRG